MNITGSQWVTGSINVIRPLGIQCPACRAEISATFQIKTDPGGMTSELDGDQVRYTVSGDLVGAKFEHDCLLKVTR
jgi:hypothetical protein